VCPNLVMLTVGTGVGGGLVFGGRLYRGATSAGELGHTAIGLDLEDGAPTPEGKHPLPGTLEYLAAGRALDRLAEREAREEKDSFLGKRLAQDGEVTGIDVVDGAEAGDADALRVLDVLGQRLGIGIANAINTFDPQEIVIGGGVSRAGDLLLEPAKRVAAEYTVPGLGRHTTIRLARHGAQAGVLGAAMVAAQEEQS
jgi:glucokinase